MKTTETMTVCDFFEQSFRTGNVPCVENVSFSSLACDQACEEYDEDYDIATLLAAFDCE